MESYKHAIAQGIFGSLASFMAKLAFQDSFMAKLAFQDSVKILDF